MTNRFAIVELMATKPMTPAPKALAAEEVPISKWLPPVLLGWLIPGGGHFLLSKHVRGGLIALAVVLMLDRKSVV